MRSNRHVIFFAALLSVFIMLSVPCAYAATTSSVASSANTATVEEYSINLYKDSACTQEVTESSAFQGFTLKYHVTARTSDFDYSFSNSNGEERISQILYLKSSASGTATFNCSIVRPQGAVGTPVVTVVSMEPEVSDPNSNSLSTTSSDIDSDGIDETSFTVTAGVAYKVLLKAEWNNAVSGSKISCTDGKYLEKIKKSHWIPSFDCSFTVVPTGKTVSPSVSNTNNVFSFKSNIEIVEEIVKPTEEGEGHVTGETTTIGENVYPSATITYDDDSAVAGYGSSANYDIAISSNTRFIIYIDAEPGLLTKSSITISYDVHGTHCSVKVESSRFEGVTKYIAMNQSGNNAAAYSTGQVSTAMSRAITGNSDSVTINIQGSSGSFYGKVTMKIIILDEI